MDNEIIPDLFFAQLQDSGTIIREPDVIAVYEKNT